MSVFDGLMMSMQTHLKESHAYDRSLGLQSKLRPACADVVAAESCDLADLENVRELLCEPLPELFPMQMPQRTCDLDSNTNFARNSPTSCQTPGGTPASLSPQLLSSQSRVHGGVQSPLLQGLRSGGEGNNQAHLVRAVPDEAVCKRDVASAAAAVAHFEAKQSHEYAGKSNFYWIREKGTCQASQENLPCTELGLDLVVLELHRVFRRHAIEPSDELVTDMLKWRARDPQTSALD